MSLSWDIHYPDRTVLKNEVNNMLQAFVEVLLEEIPDSEIKAIYHKGSAQKDWDSPLDYVPEISDIDVHLLFHDDSSVNKHFGSVVQAVNIQSKVEKRYFSKKTKPIHVPRPQLVILNQLLQDEDYIPTPKIAISVLYGEDYPETDYSSPERIMHIDCRRLISEESFLLRFPLHTVDRPSRYLWESLRLLVWHVSPTGPRALHLLGVPTEKAWSINRTSTVTLLREIGERQLAQDYSDFYLFGWEYFISKYSNTDAGRSSLVSGVRALSRGVEIAKSWLSRHQ